MQDWPGLIEAYRSWLPVSDKTPVISLREGATPLIPAPVIAEKIGRGVKVYLKYDGLNPTGSFKDRGMTMAISKAKEAGSEAVICASTGNTSAAAAAYARRGGMRAFVLIPDGYVAQGKLAQALLYGAEVIAIQGNFDTALSIVRDVADQYPITLVNSVNPYRLQGQKTAAFEVVDALGEAPDWLCIPVGNAGNITVNGNSSVTLSGASFVSTKAQTYNALLTLAADTNMNATDVTTNSTLAGGNYNLSINNVAAVDSGNLITGGDSTGLRNLWVTRNTSLNGHVASSGNQTYNGTLTLGTDANLTASSASVIGTALALQTPCRSEERRVGKECRIGCRSRWSPYH